MTTPFPNSLADTWDIWQVASGRSETRQPDQGENSRLSLLGGAFGGHMAKRREAPGFMATRAVVWAAEGTSDIEGQ